MQEIPIDNTLTIMFNKTLRGLRVSMCVQEKMEILISQLKEVLAQQ